ncbi:MAG: universal stress protein [Betaproteobacteria bacterium]|nr:universal stress protein [Betaproteobacteria bacterium]
MKPDPGWECSAAAGAAAVRSEDPAGPLPESARYKSIYIPFDNSAHALRGVDLGIAIARHTGACVTASHVYAGRLHDRRFRQMESGLPERYLEEERLAEQRAVHDDLITRGLTLISESYLDVASGKCVEAGVPFARVMLEGKNWQKLVEDIKGSGHDLVVMGALGLGAVEASLVGSVCERVARRIDRDLMVVKSVNADQAGAVVVAIDGSAHAFGALQAALELARMFGKPVEAVAVYDPNFHYVAFHGIAGVLSPAAARVFRFKEQEKLHEEIIDSGLARIYQAHLELAAKVAAAQGVELRTRLLAGKAFEQILKYARGSQPWLLAVGRVGAHSDAVLDLGSTTENLLRSAPCNLLLSARSFEPALEHVAEASVAWTREAEARIARVPEFVRGVVRRAVTGHAVERGHTVITSDVIDSCLGAMVRSRAERGTQPAASGGRGGAAKCPFAHLAKGRKRAPQRRDGP